MAELIVDLFAGGGGASEGIRLALGRDPDIAVNHSAEAIAMHTANHPSTRHFLEDVFDVNPRRVCGDRPVGLLWMSPDCTHFSKAKGGKPRSKNTRSLAWVAHRWAAEVRPRVICLENVEEFAGWGPLLEDGTPCPKRVGETFREWRRALEALGYAIEHRTLVAADYGAPTTRKRLFLVARCDGAPIVWPEPTHGKGRAHPWRTAAEIIDWTIPCPSIFERARPHAEATLRRIATGVRRYVIETSRPYVVGHVAASLVQRGYGEREGQAPRALDITKPLGTVVAGGVKHGLVAAFLSKHYGGVVGHDLHRPIGTITTQDHHALTAATLAPSRVDHRAEVRAFLARYAPASGLLGREPVVHIGGEPHEIVDIGMRMLVPAELFAAQGFRDGYDVDLDGTLTARTQTRLAGNSVCPPLAAAIVGANVRLDEGRAAA